MTKNYLLHEWDITPKQAVEIQKQLANQVLIQDDFTNIETVAGVDVGFEQKNTIARSAVAVLSFPDLTLIDYAIARRPVSFPYVPGLLAFREIPVVLDALEQLKQLPGMLLCDGQGIAHPRGLGIAAHLGLITSIPSIGVAKTRLTGDHDPVGPQKGDWAPLYIKQIQVGVVLRTRDNIKPLYISPGHKIGIMSAMNIVMQCITKYRLPETTRHAHRLASH
jgi:deoxyribonuclease V